MLVEIRKWGSDQTMENELSMPELNTAEITVHIGNIIFPEFENLKRQAEELANEISQIDVNEENIKQSKKLLAAVNRELKELEDKRIKIKKKMLEPYTVFECQVKEIVNIVKEADEIVRQQVKALEELERNEKHSILEDLFSKRIVHYSFRDLFSFPDFLKPKHLNKSTSIESVESEMVDFLEKLAKDLKVIQTMPDSQAILDAYIDSKDLAAAISLYQQREARKAKIEATKALAPAERIAYMVTTHAANLKELKLVLRIMDENGFECKVDKIEKEVF